MREVAALAAQFVSRETVWVAHRPGDDPTYFLDDAQADYVVRSRSGTHHLLLPSATNIYPAAGKISSAVSARPSATCCAALAGHLRADHLYYCCAGLHPGGLLLVDLAVRMSVAAWPWLLAVATDEVAVLTLFCPLRILISSAQTTIPL